jgi:energy-coupling factor transporter ATP-binding protein EcfA2
MMFGVRALASAAKGGARSIPLVRLALCSWLSVLPGHNTVRRFSASLFVRAVDGEIVVGENGQSSVQAAAAPPAGRSPKKRVLGVKRKDAQGLAVIRASGGMFVADLVKEIKKDLKIAAPLDYITLQLASEDGSPLTAKDAAGKEQPVTLNSRDTVDEALKKAIGRAATPEEKLCLIVEFAPPTPIARGSADPAGLPARPIPIVFKKTRFKDATGSPMHVATLDNGCPFYLEHLALQQIKDWASGEVSGDYADRKLVVLTGPIKSGKTRLLNLLPRLLSPDSHRKPVVMFHGFTNHLGPRDAAFTLVKAASRMAEDSGFRIPGIPTSGEEALADLTNVMRALAEGIYAAGGELILLLDEVQAPIVAAESPYDAARFAGKLKAIHDECRATSRIAIASGGSGAITLLNSLRNLPPNGYSLWGGMTRVHLGATPSPEAARTMAKAIIRVRSKLWPEDLKKLVTPDYVLNKLTSSSSPPPPPPPTFAGAAAPPQDDTTEAVAALALTAARPALVASLVELVTLVGRVDVGKDADAIAALAFRELHRKLKERTTLDAAVALASLDESQRRTIYYLAAGQLDFQALVGRLGDGPPQRLTELLLTLCEPCSESPDADVTLLPPYGALFKTILDAEGNLLAEYKGLGRWELNKEKLRDPFEFFPWKPMMACIKPRSTSNRPGDRGGPAST